MLSVGLARSPLIVPDAVAAIANCSPRSVFWVAISILAGLLSCCWRAHGSHQWASETASGWLLGWDLSHSCVRSAEELPRWWAWQSGPLSIWISSDSCNFTSWGAQRLPVFVREVISPSAEKYTLGMPRWWFRVLRSCSTLTATRGVEKLGQSCSST